MIERHTANQLHFIFSLNNLLAMKSHKPLTYNRFRAYLRVKLKNKHFSKKRLIFAILFYFLCSLTIFLLPLDILTKYPYLKYFTDFMDFIPAIKLMESKTFAPELCKFYASYMFVVGVVCFVGILKETFIYCARRIMHPTNAANNHKTTIAKTLAKPIKYLLMLVTFDMLVIWGIWNLFSGEGVGYARMRDEYFIYNLYEMLNFALRDIGLGTLCGLILMILSIFVFFDIFKHNILDKRKDK